MNSLMCSRTTTCRGLSIANLRKDRDGLDIPSDWAGGISGLPTIAVSNEIIENTYREYHDRFAIAGIGGVFTPRTCLR